MNASVSAPMSARSPGEAATTVEAPGRDEFDGVLPDRLDPDQLRRLSVLHPAVSSFHIFAEWVSILAAGWLGWRYWNPWFYPLAVAFIGARQHGLLVLMHDGTHYRLFRSRLLNDWVTELALAWPLLVVTMRDYRRNHFPHHRHLNTARDPDWVRKQTAEWSFPMRPARLAWLLFQDLVGIGFLKFVATARRVRAATTPEPGSGVLRAVRWGLFAVMGVVLTVWGLWAPFLLLWVVPFVTWMQFVFHVRSIAEHFAVRGPTGVYAETRTVLTGWLDDLFGVSKNVNYHLEHHLYPSVPFYRLPELHGLLMERESYRRHAHVTRGYWRVFGECVFG